MADVLVSAAAEQDFTAALCWYAQRSPQAASGFESEFERALTAIETAPEWWPSCDGQHRFYLMRRYPYQVIYRTLVDGRLLVVAVAHTSRRPGYWSGK